MSDKRQVRLSELGKIANTARDEIGRLHREIRLEEDETLVGKFFRTFVDVSDSYYIYIHVTSADSIGIEGFSYSVYDDGSIRFSNPKNAGRHIQVHFGDYHDYEPDEIAEEEYLRGKFEFVKYLSE